MECLFAIESHEDGLEESCGIELDLFEYSYDIPAPPVVGDMVRLKWGGGDVVIRGEVTFRELKCINHIHCYYIGLNVIDIFTMRPGFYWE